MLQFCIEFFSEYIWGKEYNMDKGEERNKSSKYLLYYVIMEDEKLVFQLNNIHPWNGF